MHYFEGPEKKLEIFFQEPVLPRADSRFWQDVVASANATILSKISSETIDAYLLSESSLFVTDQRLTMITCGQTQLINAIEPIFSRIPRDQAAFLIFERKNEFFPEKQSTSFQEDAARLQRIMPGKTTLFGKEKAEHIFLYQSTNRFEPNPEDTTLEVLMQGMYRDRRDLFFQAKSVDEIHTQTKIPEILSGFTIDSHLFEPYGYSMNAVRGPFYFTIHVTPQKPCTYISFETNYHFQNNEAELKKTIKKVLFAFQPKQYNVLFFENKKRLNVLKDLPGGLVDHKSTKLECGFSTEYADYEIKDEIALT